MNYDTDYDMSIGRRVYPSLGYLLNIRYCKDLRPAALETETDRASDPRSERGVPGLPKAPLEGPANDRVSTERHPSPPTATESTTSGTTCPAGGAPVVSAPRGRT